MRRTVTPSMLAMVPHVNLADIDSRALAAGQRAYEAGGSPRTQLEAARAASGQALGYKPHIGMKQRTRAMRKAARG